MEDLYKENDDEFKKMNNNEDDQEEEQENSSEEQEEEMNKINIYNNNEFELDKVLNFFFNNNIISKTKFCSKCGKPMILESNITYMDGKVWRCRSKVGKHDVKINIRENSVFENINIPLPIIYFLILYCFTEKYSIDKSYIEIKDNQNLFGDKNCTKNSISKLYSLLRERIKNSMHKIWKNNLMGNNPSEHGYPVFEIDESEIIGNNEIIYWMFGIIDRISKDSRVFCVLNDRTSNNLMKIIKDNISTNENVDMDLDEEYLENARIYSDCFASYQPNTFRDSGYILKRVNHSVWFGYGNFHTNNVEGLWSQIKRLSNNFSGLNIGKLEELYPSENEKKNYLDSWICYALFFREVEKKKLSRKGRIKLLINYIKI